MNNPSLNLLSDTELAGTTGGNPFAIVAATWIAFVKKVEENPDDYTFLMDWYYSSKN